MATQKVKSRFQAWEAMVLENGVETSLLSSLNSLDDKKSSVFTVSPDEDETKSASSGLVFGDSGTLLGGKISKIVEFLTLDNQDPELVPIFLMTFHSFTTTPLLLDMLQEQYDISPKQVCSPSMFEAFVETKLVQTKLKVVLVILHWVKNHYVEDFCDYEFLTIRLRNFTNIIKDDFQQLASQILEAMEQKMERSTSVVSTVIPKSSSVSERLKHMRKGSLSALLPIAADMFQNIHVRRRSSASSFMNTDPNYFLTDFDPSDFGRQLTILEFELYSKIPCYEILDQIWEAKILHEVASYGCAPPLERTRSTPGSSSSAISLLIQHTNDVNIIKTVYFLGRDMYC